MHAQSHLKALKSWKVLAQSAEVLGLQALKTASQVT